MKKICSPYLVLLLAALLMALFIVLGLSLSVATTEAQILPPGAGPRPPRPTPKPTANLVIRNANRIVEPAVLSSGVPMTYTFEVYVGTPSLDAHDAYFELPFNGNQQFSGFSSDNPNFRLREPVGDTVYVDLGHLKAGDGGTLTIRATFATNYDKPIFRQTVYLNWQDDNYWRRAGTNITLPVRLEAAPPLELPVTPTLPTPAGQPAAGPFAPVPYDGRPNTDTRWYFAATRHTLGGQFLNYWREHGSLIVLGYPISEEFSDGGRVIQYFERGVMEFWPENPLAYLVLLRSLGRELSEVEAGRPANSPLPGAGSVYFPETGHWLDGRFVAAWEDQGGLAQFGFPIREPVMEGDKLVQWTERARFELDLSRPYQPVMLGLVGVEAARQLGYLPQ